jgi:hypothetical protein
MKSPRIRAFARVVEITPSKRGIHAPLLASAASVAVIY